MVTTCDGNTTTGRANTLRKLVEYQEFKDAEFNRAFVLSQYFLFLRRNPDTGGYNFWLDVLNNRVPGNYRSMVCAFVTSKEYQERFSAIIPRNNQECRPRHHPRRHSTNDGETQRSHVLIILT